MTSPPSPAGHLGTPATEEEAALDDLRLRLNGSRRQALAARAEARRLARELGVARRLLRFAGGEAAPRPAAVPDAPDPTPGTFPRLGATPLTPPVVFALDACEDQGASTLIAGWAFRPVPGWDGRATTVTLLLHHGAQAFQAAVARRARPDVAAHFAAPNERLAGGATGLEATGFGCELLHRALPAGVDLELILRLDCAGMVCVQPTGRRLRF